MLLDTNILVRNFEPKKPECLIAKTAIRKAIERGYRLCIVPQILMEFWVVATRPTESNGLGMMPENALQVLEEAQRFYTLYRDTNSIFDAWGSLIRRYQVTGRKAHDTRLVAAMQVHGIREILTFNAEDFKRYEEIEILEPQSFIEL